MEVTKSGNKASLFGSTQKKMFVCFAKAILFLINLLTLDVSLKA